MADSPWDDALGVEAPPAAPPPPTINPWDAVLDTSWDESLDSSLTTQEKRVAQPPELATPPLLREVQDINAAAFNQAPHRTAMDFLGAWDAQQEFTPEQIDDAAHNSLYRFGDFMTRSGFDRVPGMQQEKKQLRDAHLALELAARLPVPPDERKKLAKATVTKMVQRRLGEIGEQVRGSGGAGREEAERLFGIGQRVLQHLTEDDADKLYARALYESAVPPVNSQEGKLMAEAPGMGWTVWGPSAPGAEGMMSPEQMRIDLDQVFGDTLPLLRDEMVREKTAFTLARRGLVANQPGYTPDGLNFTLFVPGGTMERLTAGKVQNDPEAQQSILQVRRKNGPLVANEYMKRLTEETLNTTIRHIADVTSAPPGVDQANPQGALTPTQKEEAGVWAVWADAFKDIAGGLSQAAAATDRALSSSRFVRESIIPSLMREYAGDIDTSAQVKTLANVLTTSLRMTKQMLTGGTGALRERVREIGLNPDSPAAQQMLMSIDQNIGAGVQEYWKDTYRKLDDDYAYISRWRKGLEPWDSKKMAEAAGRIAFANLTMEGAELAALFVDNPHEFAAQAAMGAVIGRVAGPVAGALGDAETAILNGWRLGNDIKGVLRRHPWKAKKYIETAKRLVGEGLKKGTAADTLNNLTAVLETFMERTAGDGVGRSLGEVARIVKRAWPELRDGLGQEGYLMGSKAIPRNWLGQLGRMLGVVKMPSKKLLNAITGPDETLDKVLGVVKDLAGAGPIARELEANVRAFVEREGTAPTPEQLQTLLPERLADVDLLMRAAENNGLSDRSISKLWQRLTGGPELDLNALAGSVEDMLNQYTNGALGLIDSMGRWGIVRDRATILVDTAFKRLDMRSQVLEYKLDQLRQLREPGHPEVDAQIKAVEAELFDLKRRTNRLSEAKARILKHEPSEAWNWAPEDAEILFVEGPDGKRLIDAETLELTLQMHPALFEGVLPESLYRPVQAHQRNQTVRQAVVSEIYSIQNELRSASPSRASQLNTELSSLRTRLAELDLNPEAANAPAPPVASSPGAPVQGPPSLFKSVRRPMPQTVLDDMAKRATELEGVVQARRKELREAPGKDEALLEWGAQLKEVEATIDRLVKGGAEKDDPVLAQRRAGAESLKTLIKKRKAAIREKLITPSTVTEARIRLDDAVAAHKDHMANAARRRKTGLVVYELDPTRYRQVIGMVRHEGLTDLAREGINVLGSHREQAAVLKFARQYGNPYDARWLPARHKAKLLHDQSQAMGWGFQSAVQLSADFAEVLSRVPQSVRDIIGEAQRTGSPIDPALLDKYPDLKKVYKDANALNTVVDNMRFYVESEGRTFEEFLAFMEDVGWAPKHVVDSWRKGEYDPRLFAVGRREQFVTRKKARQKLQKEEQLGGHPELAAVAQNQEELRFRREPDKWRLRVQETDRVVDRLFDSKEDLDAYMAEVYGRDAWKDIGGAEKGKHTGRTIYNEPITIGTPLTPEERAVNGEIFGNTAEKRVIRMEGLMKNSYLNALSSALNAFGGMVVTPEQYAAERLSRFADQYVPVRDNPEIYGALAGKYVHRRVLGTLAEAARTFETFNGVLKGFIEGIETTGPGNKILSTLGRAASKWDEIAKSNLILKSPRALGANILFNFLSAKLAGANRFLSVEGMGMFWEKVIKERPGKKLRISPLPQKDPTEIAWGRLRDNVLRRARGQGLIGGLFEAENEAVREMGRRIFGLVPEERDKLTALQARRQQIYEQVRAAKLAGGKGQDALLSRLDRDMVAIEEAVREMNAGWLKRVGRKLSSFFIETGKRDAIGRPTNQWWNDYKRFYNHIDEASKVLMFQELVDDQGIPDDVAAGRIKLFAQDYAGLPPIVRRVSKSGINSLITSFPAEAYRIGFNGLMHAPNNFLSIMMAIPFLNLTQFATAGIGVDRALAMLEARGQKSGMDKLAALFTDVYTVDPRRRAITGSMGFSSLLPFGTLFREKGLLGQMYDKMVSPDTKGMLAETGRATTGFLSNFVGSGPKFNWIGYWLTGKDPQTGQVLIDDKMPLVDKIKAMGSLLGKDTLPPLAPGGRDWEALQRGGRAGVSPKTGRLRGADEPITALVRGVTGVTVRGTVAEKLGALLGIGTRARDPVLVDDDDLIIKAGYDAEKAMPQLLGTPPSGAAQYGEHNELRDLVLRTQDPSLTDEQRKRADKDAEALYKQMHRFELNSVKGAVSVTEREFRLFKAKVLQDDPAGWFATLPMHVQAAALANIDQWGVRDDKIRELLKRSQFSDGMQIRTPSDPQLVQYAIDILDQRLKVPGHNPRLDGHREWLQKLKVIAGAREMEAAAKAPLREMIKKAVRKKLAQ